MASGSTRDSERSQTASQFNARLPRLTHTQINRVAADHGLTKTQVIILAVDRLLRDLDAQSVEADKDLRRLKTTARIAPHIDLGQDG